MTHLRSLVALVMLAALSACSAYLPRYAPAEGAFETGYYENIQTPRLALLEYRLGKYFAQKDRPYPVVCAAAAKMIPHIAASRPRPLDPDVELKLIERFPGLSPQSRCEREGLDIVASDTRQAAAIFDVHDFVCDRPTECLGYAGYYANGRHGWSYYRMTFADGQWRIEPEELNIVLTAGTQENVPPKAYAAALPDTPAIALLTELLDEQFANPDRVPTTCATIASGNRTDQALPEEVELALMERYPELAPFERCVWKGDVMVVDAITGERAVIYSVRRLACTTPVECTAWGGWITANLGAQAWEYRLRRVEGKWIAERTGNGVIS